jgi:hypothetical protein
MTTFITLINENQLNPSEKNQVLTSIKNEYENMLDNFNEVRRNENSVDFVINEMDINV